MVYHVNMNMTPEYSDVDPVALIEYQRVECPAHNPDGCECDNGIATVVIDHGFAEDMEPDYEPDDDYEYDPRAEPDIMKQMDDYIDEVDRRMGYTR